MQQRFFLGRILFYIFIGDFFLWIKNADLENFADDNTISVNENILEKLLYTWEKTGLWKNYFIL